ncbi:cell wall metabolism sensor histidine kinase WalK [Sphingobium sp. CFD-2]|uniref:sensor histidine kinase n=1 Tax=Sphingobium sp. CFD-2 TaxID=2878542 RepID=UPI00214C3B43|nr:HAMP domain-containing sensor histidine kinase [Sphingobium sp. CFD-2]
MRLLPRSLVGRMAFLLGAALAVAQLANFGLILNEREKLALAQNDGPAITRFAGAFADISAAEDIFRKALAADLSHRGARFALRADSGIAEGDRSDAVEARLAEDLRNLGVNAQEVRASAAHPQLSRRKRADGSARYAVSLAARLPDGQWLAGTLPAPRRDPGLVTRLAAATLLLYLVVLGVTIVVARHLARPLRDLAMAAGQFRGRTAPLRVEPRGPDDLREAIAAFNDMNQRLVALLDEKDGMLGAIGHDLRTPLASLRIRLENMEPADEREAAIRKIGETMATLEDILSLATAGRQREALRPADVTALVETAVEEYQDLGENVAWEPAVRHVLPVQRSQLKRAVQNLIGNAIKYGCSARVTVVAAGDTLRIEVADKGPGIPADQIARVTQPFYRIEESRNRETGGSGLGLAITKAIAESHGGALVLEDTGQGLRACIMLPGLEKSAPPDRR